MSRTFNGTTDDLVGTITAWPLPSDYTIGAWVYPASAGEGSSGVVIRMDSSGTTRTIFRINSASRDLTALQSWNGGNSSSVSTNTIGTSAWSLVVATHRTSDKKMRIFTGDLNNVMVEASYASQTAGIGSMQVGGTCQIGNNAVGVQTQTWDGRICQAFAIARELSLDEMEAFRQGDWTVLYNTTEAPRFFLPLDTAANVDVAQQIAFSPTGTGTAEDPPIASGWSGAGAAPVARHPNTATQNITPAGPTVSITPGTLIPTLAGLFAPLTVTITPGELSLTAIPEIELDGPTVTVTEGELFLTPQTPLAFDAAAVAVNAGTLGVAPPAQDVSPAGGDVAITEGTVAFEIQVSPAGADVSVSPGALAPPDRTMAPSGATVNATPGTLGFGAVVLPAGPSVSVTPGAVTITTGPISISPVGPTVAVSPGTVSFKLTLPLHGPTVGVTPGALALQLMISVMQTVAAITVGQPNLGSGIHFAAPTVTVTAGNLIVVRAGIVPGFAKPPFRSTAFRVRSSI